ALQPLGGVAVDDPLEPRDQHALHRTSDLESEAALAAFVLERPIGGDRLGLGGEALDPQQAAHAMGASDDAHQHAPRRAGHRSAPQTEAPPPSPAAAP